MKTFKILSALLSYPTQDLIEAAPEVINKPKIFCRTER